MARGVIGSLPSTGTAHCGFEFAEAFGGNTNEAIRNDPYRLESAGSLLQYTSLLLAQSGPANRTGRWPLSRD